MSNIILTAGKYSVTVMASYASSQNSTWVSHENITFFVCSGAGNEAKNKTEEKDKERDRGACCDMKKLGRHSAWCWRLLAQQRDEDDLRKSVLWKTERKIRPVHIYSVTDPRWEQALHYCYSTAYCSHFFCFIHLLIRVFYTCSSRCRLDL